MGLAFKIIVSYRCHKKEIDPRIQNKFSSFGNLWELRRLKLFECIFSEIMRVGGHFYAASEKKAIVGILRCAGISKSS
jgi:hypothetical protein